MEDLSYVHRIKAGRGSSFPSSLFPSFGLQSPLSGSDIMLKKLFEATISKFLNSGSAPVDYKWEDLVRDQLLMAEGSIRRNLFSFLDELIVTSNFAFDYIHDNKNADKDPWMTIIDIASNTNAKCFEEDFSLQYNTKSLKILLQRKLDIISYALDKYKDCSSVYILKGYDFDNVVNQLSKYICDSIRSELKIPFAGVLFSVQNIRKHIPFVKKILKKPDWSNYFKLIMENQEGVLPGKTKAQRKNKDIKQLSDFINEVNNFGLSINILISAYNKAMDSMGAYLREKMEGVYAEIKSNLDEYYTEKEIAAFCTVYVRIFQENMKKEVARSADGLYEDDPYEQDKLVRYCMFLVNNNINEAFKGYFETIIENLEGAPE